MNEELLEKIRREHNFGILVSFLGGLLYGILIYQIYLMLKIN